MRVRDIAEALAAEFRGDGDHEIARILPPRGQAAPGDLILAMTPESLGALSRSSAHAVVVRRGSELPRGDYAVVLEVREARAALATLTALFDLRVSPTPGVHPSAVVASTAIVAGGASIGPLAVIGDGASICDGTEIGAHVTVGAGVIIGAQCSVRPGARIGERTIMGDRVVVHENAGIGADGFSFIPPRELGDGALPAKIRSIGAVRIGDDVEIGAGTTIDRATLAETVIGRGTKIDNLVQIGHNVVIGEACLIAGMVGISGSVVIGDRVMIGGGVGIADHVTVGSDAVIFAGSGVGNNVPEGGMVSGYPAIPHQRSIDQVLFLGRHKRVASRLDSISARLDRLEGQLGGADSVLPEPEGASS